MVKVKLICKNNSPSVPSVSRSGGIRYTGGGSNADYAAESGHSAESDHAAEADHAANADNAALAAEATHAASSADLDKESSVWTTIKGYIDTLKKSCLKWFLRKDIEDTAAKKITFAGGLDSDGSANLHEGLTVGRDGKYSITKEGRAVLKDIVAECLRSDDFKQGYMGGSGFGLYKQDGRSYIEADNLIVRVKAYFSQLEIRKLSYVGGDQVKSFAGSIIAKVVPLDSEGKEITGSAAPNAYKCYFIDDDGTTRTENWWQVGDQARCQTFDIEAGVYHDISNKYYWRLVTATGSEDVEIEGTTRHMGYVVLSNNADGFTIADSDAGKNIQDESGNDIVFIGYDSTIPNDTPAEGDSIVQMGSQASAVRSYAVIDFISEQRTSYYRGINGYSLPEHEVMRLSPKGSWVYTSFFEMRVGSPTEWHPQTDYRGTWDAEASYTYYNTVTYDGLLWMHNKRGYVSIGDEPNIFSEVWTCVSDGGNALRIEFESSKGKFVYVSNADLTLTAHLMFGQKIMDDYLFKDSRNQLSWSRDSGVESEDRSWNPVLGDRANILLLTHHKKDINNRHDMGSQWEKTLRCSFTFHATIYSGDINSNAKRYIPGTLDFDLLD